MWRPRRGPRAPHTHSPIVQRALSRGRSIALAQVPRVADGRRPSTNGTSAVLTVARRRARMLAMQTIEGRGSVSCSLPSRALKTLATPFIFSIGVSLPGEVID